MKVGESIGNSVKKNILIDYLTVVFTLPEYQQGFGLTNSDDFNLLVDLLTFNIEDLETHEKGINSYKYKCTFGEYIKIGIHGPKNRHGDVTHMLDMSGEACRDFEKRGGSWEHLLKFCYINGWKFTRIDVANDIIIEDPDDSYLFDMDTLVKKYIDNQYHSSGFIDSTLIIGKYNSDGKKKGTSITFGSRNSRMVLQIYDKKEEQKAKYQGNTDTSKMYVWASSWIRFEIRMMQGKAADFVGKLINNGYENLSNLYVSILKGILNFKYRPGNVPKSVWEEMHPGKKQRKSTSNERRDKWITCKWWDEHLGNVKSIKLIDQYKLETSITKSKDWVNRSVSRNMTKIALADPDEFLQFFLSVLEKGKEKITKKELLQIEDYRSEFNLPELQKNKMFQKFDLLYEKLKNIEKGNLNE
jgi:phage replication initiation protein